MPAKSSCRLNGETVSGKQLKQAASILIDLHGQHEHQSLLDEKKHKELLDLYCGQELAAVKDKLQEAYREYRAAEKALDEALTEDAGRERETALAEFEVKEIEEASLCEGEDETLEQEFKKMENIRLIGEQLGGAKECLSGYEQENAQSLLEKAYRCVKDAAAYDTALAGTADNLMQAEELLHDSVRTLEHYLDNLSIDGETYTYTKERLDLINHLKTKYGSSISAILSYAEEQNAFLRKFQNFEQYKEELSLQKEKAYRTLLGLCDEADAIRRREAALLGEKLQQALLSLNFPYARFAIEITQDEGFLSKDGNDHVSFQISLNAGEQLRPLAKVASGGELSRIMLALKAVLAGQDEIETLIFDEIDAGISGRTAWKVSEKLAVLGRHHQVICITHLAQIAAMADVHFVIEKTQTEQSTKIQLTRLDEQGMLSELARLLGSDAVTEAVMQNAAELKETAKKTKLAK
jgi:DNA repair protein RecN (Recombination protein N)